MGAFKGAVEVGTHAIETDVHLTKDDVVVLSHVSPDISTALYRRWLIIRRMQPSSDALVKMKRS